MRAKLGLLRQLDGDAELVRGPDGRHAGQRRRLHGLLPGSWLAFPWCSRGIQSLDQVQCHTQPHRSQLTPQQAVRRAQTLISLCVPQVGIGCPQCIMGDDRLSVDSKSDSTSSPILLKEGF